MLINTRNNQYIYHPNILTLASHRKYAELSSISSLFNSSLNTLNLLSSINLRITSHFIKCHSYFLSHLTIPPMAITILCIKYIYLFIFYYDIFLICLYFNFFTVILNYLTVRSLMQKQNKIIILKNNVHLFNEHLQPI